MSEEIIEFVTYDTFLLKIAAMGGGIGEWMLLESLFITSTGPQTYISLTAIFAGSLAALGAGMSIIAFTKYFSFMTRNRENSKRSSDVRTPLSIAGPAVLIMGIIAPVIITEFITDWQASIPWVNTSVLPSQHIICNNKGHGNE